MTKRVLITGATGLIGRKVAQRLDGKFDLILASTQTQALPQGVTEAYDLKDTKGIARWLDRFRPEVVIHTAAVTSADYAETHPTEAQVVNVDASAEIAKWCGENDARMVHFSTDFVFDGLGDDYRETDDVKPLNRYGRTKVESEDRVRALVTDHVIVRPILVYGTAPELSRLNFPLLVMARLGSGQSMRITADQFRMPTFADDLGSAVHKLVEHPFTGTLHLCGPEKLSVYEFALKTAEVFDLDAQRLTPVTTSDMYFAAPRPMVSGFDTSLAEQTIGWDPMGVVDGLLAMKP